MAPRSSRPAGAIRWSVALLLLAAVSVATAEGTAPDLRYTTVRAADGVPLAMITAGPATREGILFLHGFSLTAEAFLPQLTSALADRWRLVAFDLRGHGSSGKPWETDAYRQSERWAADVEAVRRAAGLDRMILVGWSYGGTVALDYLRHYGDDHVAGIELTGSLGGLLPREQVAFDPVKMAAAAANSARAVSPQLGERIAAAAEFADRLVAGQLPPELRAKLVVMPLLLPPHAREAMMGRSLDNTDLRDRIVVPLRFSHGTLDALVPAASLERLLALLPTAEAVAYPATGHALFIEQTALYNRRLGDFARQNLEAAD